MSSLRGMVAVFRPVLVAILVVTSLQLPVPGAGAASGLGIEPQERARVMQATVLLETRMQGTRELSACAGALVHPDGYVLTAWHCIGAAVGDERAAEKGLQPGDLYNSEGLVDGYLLRDAAQPPERALKAQVVGGSASLDVAVLKITEVRAGRRLPEPLSLGDSAGVQVGEIVHVVGYPNFADDRIAMVSGAIRSRAPDGSLTHDAATTRGFSGGPVVNERGQLVGVHSHRSTDARSRTSYGIAVPVNAASGFVQEALRSAGSGATAAGAPARAPTAAPPDTGHVINVDSPARNGTVSGTVQITGWAIDPTVTTGTGIDQVHVYVNGLAGTREGRLLGAARYGSERPDVAQARGGPRFTPSGFELSWDTLSVAPGPHTLYIYARNTRDVWSYAEVPVTVAPDRRPPAGASTQPPSGTSTQPPASGAAAPGGPRTVGVGLPSPTPGLPRFEDHPTDETVARVVSLTPPPPGIRWSVAEAQYNEDEQIAIVLLGLAGNARVQTWLALPVAEQEQFLRQFLVNLGESYVNDDAFGVIVAMRMTASRREEFPSFVQDRYIRQQSDGTFQATWPDVIAVYTVSDGRMSFKSARMSQAGPTLTQ